MDKNPVVYRPILFILFTYCITWGCVFFLAYQTFLDYSTLVGTLVLYAMDFIKSAAPLIVAIILLHQSLFRGRALSTFVFGYKPKLSPYVIVFSLFIFQFLSFYFSRLQSNSSITILGFLGAWMGQILFGGGLEEGGWRGYLQPAFERKRNTCIGVFCVSLVWSCWHLPYFFLPNSFQSGTNFLFYVVTSTATAFTLTAIHKLTGSVLLCTLFHGWQNAIVLNIPADMGKPLFLFMFILQTAVSIILCVKASALRADCYVNKRFTRA